MSTRLKRLVARRQRALKSCGKGSPEFKSLRAQVKVEVKKCKGVYYNNKVNSLKETNPSRWWSEVKALGGLTSTSEWWHQMINTDVPSSQDLAEGFNRFLFNLTAHFNPLQQNDVTSLNHEQDPVFPEFLISDHKAYKALCALKLNKSSGPDRIPARVWKEFAFELALVVSDLQLFTPRRVCS